MNRYEGSFVLVSHDRFFIAKTANKIWEIVNHEIKEFKGTYDEWVEWNERMEKQRMAESKGQKSKNELTKSETPSAAKQVKPEPPVENSLKPIINKELQKELQKQQKLFQKLEQQMAELNKQKADLEIQLGQPDIYTNKQSFSDTENKYKSVVNQLKELNISYEQVFEKIMELEAE
jgi:ATP-binding cassette subfamily F protein 3